MKTSLKHPSMADFVNALDRINALAEAHPGFVWRLKDEASGNATGENAFGEEFVVNMSVWKDAESLKDYVYKSDHSTFMRRRAEWFERIDVYQVLWWMPKGKLPDLAEAKLRLESLKSKGPTEYAFGIKEALGRGVLKGLGAATGLAQT